MVGGHTRQSVNGGVQRFSQVGWKSTIECNGIRGESHCPKRRAEDLHDQQTECADGAAKVAHTRPL